MSEFCFDDGVERRKQFTWNGVRYEAREALEDAAIRYRAAAMAGMGVSVGDDGEPKFQNDVTKAVDTEPVLVGLCTFYVTEEPDRDWTPVGVDEVRRWPARVVKPLFNWIREVSDLSEADDVASLKKQRDRLDKKIARLEGSGPKG